MNINEDYAVGINISEAETHMCKVAAHHLSVIYGSGEKKIISNMKSSWMELKRTHEFLSSVSDKLISFVPAAHWIIDNYYIMEKEAKIFKQNATWRFYSELPILSEGQLKGYPRIYAVAKEMINCTGFHLDEGIIVTLLKAYQTVTPLTLDELMAFLDMIKACIIENLNMISRSTMESIKIKEKADKIADELLDGCWSNNLIEQLDEHFASEVSLSNPSFITHVLYRLKEASIDDETLRQWIISRLKNKNVDLTSAINSESQNQARLQVSAGALVTSLREESALDFEVIFEKVSCVEIILSNDPVKIYSKMNFDTRYDYHSHIRRLSRRFNISEVAVAKEAVRMSNENFQTEGEYKHSHVGYYLLGKGIVELTKSLGYKPNPILRIRNVLQKSGGVLYFSGIAVITLLICLFANWYTIQMMPKAGVGLLILGVIAMIIPAITIASEIVNYLSLKLIKPKTLPCMAFTEGIPNEFRTIAVMPVALGSTQQVRQCIKRIETHYLANNDENLYFGILGDLKDSHDKELDDDHMILEEVINGIKSLNEKYAKGGERFFVFTRERKWNEKQGTWMGWERKRGILEEFNALIVGQQNNSFSTIIGNIDIINSMRFVITIDAGTELVRDSAKVLVGMMAHPLNMPILNKDKTLVVDGYAIIQPRVGIRIASALSTYFSQIFSGQSGIDTYASAVADVYQDVFGKGTFSGKGIYDPRVFNQIVGKSIPENAVLSHDLLEGSYAQTALANNVQLMDDFPSSIASFFPREHRWIRGDWQLLPWLFGKNPLTALSRYKIADNLRRSLIPISHVLLIFLALSLFSWQFYVWATVVLFTTLFPLLINVSKTTLIGIEKFGGGFNVLNHLRNILMTSIQGIIWFMILPYRAHIAADAITRTLYRLLISKKRMLEWKTAEAVERNLSNDLISYMRRMWISPVAGIAVILVSKREYLIYAIVITALWFFSPLVSYLIGLSSRKNKESLGEKEKSELRLIARKTWRFFEEFFSEDDNWLIPDNYQVWPENGVAHRTSTTNIGLQLSSTLSARDFGYIGIITLIDRTEKIFLTLSKLDKWNGHFYNWYDTRTLDVLIPKYVSTVDSGNFIGFLIAFKNGLLELKEKPVFNIDMLNGLKDTAALANIELSVAEPISNDEWEDLFNNLKTNSCNKCNVEINKDWARLLDSMCDSFLNDIKFFSNKNEQKLGSIKLSENNSKNAKEFLIRINELIVQIDYYITSTDFKPLYNKKRNLLRIGFNVTLGIADNSYYDLLASEARLASFIAIAKGDIPQKHWFKLGRMLTLVGGNPTLISWSGTMFEYLMPDLLLKLHKNTLLQQTELGAVKKQIQYGKKISAPWGMSEAAYYRFDQHLNYQYRAIGVPGLGFSTDLGKFLVIAPYATMLAVNIAPIDAYKNIKLLKQLGVEGDYGFYEAVDFITPKNEKLKKQNIVKSFFAHHQGMSLVSLNNFINKKSMQERFHKEPIIQATEIILEEKQPSHIVIRDPQKDIVHNDTQKSKKKQSVQRIISNTKPLYPVAHILSNNRYSLMLTSGGTGFSWNNDTVINRWRSDAVSDSHGMFFYIKNLDTQTFWSSTFQPVCTEPDKYDVAFSLDKAEFKREDGTVKTKTEVVISPQDNVEIRHITLTNNGEDEINLDVTSYMEVVIDKYNNDLAHPAFSKLFIETEYIDEKQTLLTTRRPRESMSERKWLMQTILVDGKAANRVEFETDRSKFIGRNNTLASPEALTASLQLSNTEGKVLDAIMSLRVRIKLAPGKSRKVTYINGIAETRQDAIKLSSEYKKPHAVEDTFKMALINSEVELQYLDITSQQASAIQDIVGSIYYPTFLMRGPIEAIEKNNGAQSGLWRFGISGDNPIILLRIREMTEIDAVKDAILTYEYLKMKGVKLDLVILNEKEEGYFRELSQVISDLVSTVKIFDTDSKKPGVFMINSGTMEPRELNLILTVSRVVLTEDNRILSKRLRKLMLEDTEKKEYNFNGDKTTGDPRMPFPSQELEFFNGMGGFSKDGTDYVTILKNGQNTPNPWINVIANKTFGCHISTSGSGYTWATNSRENKITTWSNDPVSDQPSEVIYIRDEETGKVFTPTPLPIRERGEYKVRHGFGYSIFEHNSYGLEQKMTVFVAQSEPIKIYKVSLTNKTEGKRKLSLTYYAELILGVSREQTAPYIITRIDNSNDILTAVNTYNEDMPNGTAFMFSSEKVSSYTGDKSDFLGQCGFLDRPVGLNYKELTNKVGAALNPCGALKIDIELESGEQKEVIFALGEIDDSMKMSELAQKYRKIENVNSELETIKRYWEDILGQIKVSTPDSATNYLLNGWLTYQTISCRLFARAAFYQSGGAIGFRDQLQDSMSLLHTAPDIAKEIIIRHSSRQFEEGDVQHWWHNDTGRGVRTKMSDDLLWLPYVLATYIKNTGDMSILDEETGYLKDKELGENETERFSIPNTSEDKGTIYEHCIKAVERTLKFGEHGLPLIGTGDWNDGMNKVGIEGKGESVWLAWFMYDVLNKVAPICQRQGEEDRADKYNQIAKSLLESIESNAWDGEWYLRAYFDNGALLGSRQNMECQIDGISQAWSVISGGASAERAKISMESVKKYLVKEEDQIVLLLTPPFDKMQPDPGYIKGYIPGIRENGGQYTHAAVWDIIAFAKLRKGNIAYKLFGMLNPIKHTNTFTGLMTYKNEPYVMSADVYSTNPCRGRGGWSWYTGAAGWMYQAGIEWILGINKIGDKLKIDPTIPKEWPGFEVEYCYKGSKYNIEVKNPQGLSSGVVNLYLDGEEVSEKIIQLKDDGNTHNVVVIMGSME